MLRLPLQISETSFGVQSLEVHQPRGFFPADQLSMILKVKLKYRFKYRVLKFLLINIHISVDLKLVPCINSFCWLCLVLLFPQSKAENLVFCFNVQGSGIEWRLLKRKHRVLFIFFDLIKRQYEKLAISLCLKRIQVLKTKLWTDFAAFLLKADSCAVCCKD